MSFSYVGSFVETFGESIVDTGGGGRLESVKESQFHIMYAIFHTLCFNITTSIMDESRPKHKMFLCLFKTIRTVNDRMATVCFLVSENPINKYSETCRNNCLKVEWNGAVGRPYQKMYFSLGNAERANHLLELRNVCAKLICCLPKRLHRRWFHSHLFITATKLILSLVK